MNPLCLAALLLFQDPAPPKSEWRDMDRILVIINEEAVTRSSFNQQLKRYMAQGSTSDSKLAKQVLEEEIKNAAVGSQAGEAMGVDTAQLRRIVRDYEQFYIRQKGGVEQYSQALAQEGVTAEERRKDYEKLILRKMWEESRTGEGANQQKQVIADRYVRPGTLRLTYAQIADDPRLVARIDGKPPMVELQILELDPVKLGGTSQAAEEAARIRARIASGESDFEQESRFAMKDSKSGPREPLDEGRLPIVDPALAKLVANAKAGELLPPLAPQGNTQQWRIVKLLRRTPGVVPGFRAPGVQHTIRDMCERRLDERRLELARRQQFESSYIWVWEPPAPVPAPAPARAGP